MCEFVFSIICMYIYFDRVWWMFSFHWISHGNGKLLLPHVNGWYLYAAGFALVTRSTCFQNNTCKSSNTYIYIQLVWLEERVSGSKSMYVAFGALYIFTTKQRTPFSNQQDRMCVWVSLFCPKASVTIHIRRAKFDKSSHIGWRSVAIRRGDDDRSDALRIGIGFQSNINTQHSANLTRQKEQVMGYKRAF